ncbi:DUF2190 family protein [Sphingobium sp. AS12]|uniref:DUF2190 family protein n=1 Tax=Sphingobium sp. AS12 TaxID=2849495 RepID=UPI001C31C863|nr:DUF2190 family protein [Sphingobium sp. AS12]MBV2148614.1 DUF2190 family protein [Sphingobium sp. AS12]
MKNYIQAGVNVDCIAPYAVASGAGFLDGAEFAVASTDAALGAPVVGVTRGMFTLPKAAVTVVRKTIAYWDNTAKVVTNVASGNTKIGIFQAAAASNVASVAVKLIPTI